MSATSSSSRSTITSSSNRVLTLLAALTLPVVASVPNVRNRLLPEAPPTNALSCDEAEGNDGGPSSSRRRLSPLDEAVPMAATAQPVMAAIWKRRKELPLHRRKVARSRLVLIKQPIGHRAAGEAATDQPRRSRETK